MAKAPSPAPVADVHVLPAGDRWEVTRSGRDVALAVFTDREAAVAWCREHAGALDARAIVIHQADYRIAAVLRLDVADEAAPRR